ncbi:THAP domain-containing protein 2-like [Homalodisca vitripennis]|uniref:THAP domain-containing protein 2-like n=1 Tax=Homalodisca vitripennis TaxID=197043 RepID=UPI001EEC5D59|nr:THAP domain-containing protein 2-like [Homalodisca vitripennis]
MPMSCVAFGCFNKGKLEGITYHSFPKGAEQRQRWINAVRRKDWEPNRHSRLCSSHFREADID